LFPPDTSTMDDELSIPKENPTLLKIRVERLERKIQEMQLRTEEEILSMEQDLEQRKEKLIETLEKIGSELHPEVGVNYLTRNKVSVLHKEGKELRKEIKRLESDISEQVTLANNLIRESLDIQTQTDKILKEIMRANWEQTGHIRTLGALGEEKARLTAVMNDQSIFEACNHDFRANLVPTLADKEYFLLGHSLRHFSFE
jgi:phage host-nuclease inhibitor protein Gam